MRRSQKKHAKAKQKSILEIVLFEPDCHEIAPHWICTWRSEYQCSFLCEGPQAASKPLHASRQSNMSRKRHWIMPHSIAPARSGAFYTPVFFFSFLKFKLEEELRGCDHHWKGNNVAADAFNRRGLPRVATAMEKEVETLLHTSGRGLSVTTMMHLWNKTEIKNKTYSPDFRGMEDIVSNMYAFEHAQSTINPGPV